MERKKQRKEQPPNGPGEKPDEPKLEQLLARESQLQAKLADALSTGRYFITISCQKKETDHDEHDLQHFWIRKNYMVNDVVPSLKHITSDFIAKENPTAELPDKKNWH